MVDILLREPVRSLFKKKKTRSDLQNQVNQSTGFPNGFVRKLVAYYVGMGKEKFSYAYWSSSTKFMLN